VLGLAGVPPLTINMELVDGRVVVLSSTRSTKPVGVSGVFEDVTGARVDGITG